MPLWRRRSKQFSQSQSDGPPVLPDNFSSTTREGHRRISLSLPQLRSLYAPRKGAHQEPKAEDEESNYGHGVQIWNWHPRAASTTDLKGVGSYAAHVDTAAQSRDAATVDKVDGQNAAAPVRTVKRRIFGFRSRSSSSRPGSSQANTPAQSFSMPEPSASIINYSRPVNAVTSREPAAPGSVAQSPPSSAKGVSQVPVTASNTAQSLRDHPSTPPHSLSPPPVRKRDRGPPPSSFPLLSSYNMASDFRVSPTAHAAAQSQPTPQTVRRIVDSARVQSLRKSRAPTRLNIMVVGEAATGKTLFLRSLLQDLLSVAEHTTTSNGGDADHAASLAAFSDEASYQKAAVFGISRTGKHLRTKRIEVLEGIDLSPSGHLLLRNLEKMTSSTPAAKDATSAMAEGKEEKGPHDGAATVRRARKNSVSSAHSVATTALAAAAAPSRLTLSLIDTPSLPSALPPSLSGHSSQKAPGAAPQTPYFLRPVIDEVVSRYSTTLREEAKLRRTPSKSGSMEGEHVHVIVWFIEPREILEGDRGWWKELRDKNRWDKREKRHSNQERSKETRTKRKPGSKGNDPPPPPLPNGTITATEGTQASADSPTKPTEKDAASRRRTNSTPNQPADVPRTLKRSTSAAALNAGTSTVTSPIAAGTGARPGESDERPNGSHERGQSVSDVPGPGASTAIKAPEPAVRPRSSSTATGAGDKGVANGSQSAQAIEEESDEEDYVPTLSPSQKLVLSRLLPLVPVLPIIAKAETLTVTQLRDVRQAVRRGWSEVVGQLENQAIGRASENSTFGWGWIGFDPDSSDDEDDDEESAQKAPGTGPAETPVPVVHIKSRRSYSQDYDRTASPSGSALSGDAQKSGIDASHRRLASEASDVDQTQQQVEGRPSSKHGSTISGRREGSASAARHSGLGRASIRHDQGDREARLALGVEEVVPPNERLHRCWPLAIWTPELARHSATKTSDATRKSGDTVDGDVDEACGSNAAAVASDKALAASSTTVAEIPARKTANGQLLPHPLPTTRDYPFGYQLHLLDPRHSDFLALKCILLGTHTSTILETSKEAFETWRGVTLEQTLKVKEQQKRQSASEAQPQSGAPASNSAASKTNAASPKESSKEKGWVVL
ncbi:unnamed protein product [Parajaminaea phylloscopi]